MIGDVAVVTDSASYLPEDVRRRYGVYVVPMTVVIDGREYREGVDLDAVAFYEMLPAASRMTTSQPSPGALLDAYREAVRDGASRILSVHIGRSLSGTVQSAELAASIAWTPVTVIDTGQASFAEGLVVWEVLEALAAGVPLERMADVARDASSRVGNTFIVKALDLLRRGGRFREGAVAVADPVPVLALAEGRVAVAGSARDVDEAVMLMAQHVREAAAAAQGCLRVGIGHGAAPEIAAALRRHVEVMPGVDEVIDYEVGPSIGAHTGAGNAGAVFIDRTPDAL